MRLVGLQCATRTKRIRTTRPAVVEQRPADLVERVFKASAPNRPRAWRSGHAVRVSPTWFTTLTGASRAG